MSAAARWGPRRLWPAIGTAAIALAAIWVYHPALRGDWLWDDNGEVSENPALRDPAGWWKPWVAPAGQDYFPLKSSMQWVEWRLWGDGTTGYHAVNIALHCLGALLLWRLLSKLFALGGDTGPAGARGMAAWAGGLLFAVHPVAVESVAWISELKNVLSLPPLLLGFSAYVDWEGAPVAETARFSPSLRNAGALRYSLALFCFLLALLCKTSVVMFPVFLLLYAWWRRGRVGRDDVRRTLPFFALSLALGIVTLWFQWHRAIGKDGPVPGLGWRVAQSGWSLLAYLRDCVWPAGLMPIYPPAPSAWLALLAPVVLGGLIAVLCLRRDSWGRPGLLGLGWFFLNLVPALGLIPMSYLRVAPRADHLAYVSLAGVVGLAAAGVLWLAKRARVSPNHESLAASGTGRWSDRIADRVSVWMPLVAALLVAAVLAAVSHGYAAAFRSQETLWITAIRKNPGAWLACNNLGKVLLRQGRLSDAIPWFEKAARVGPPSAEVHGNLGYAYEGLGRRDRAQAEYLQAIRIDPAFAGSHYDLGHLWLESGRTAQAAEEFRLALAIDPASAKAHNNLGLALARLGQVPQALAEYQTALRLNSKLVEAWVNLGNLFFRLDRQADAVESYRSALRTDPGSAAAHHNLGAVLRRMGREDEARLEFAAASALNRR